MPVREKNRLLLKKLGTVIYLMASDVSIPASVININGGLLFYDLKHLRVSWSTPLVVQDLFSESMLTNHSLDKVTLHVPTSTKDLYANAEGWKLIKNIVEDHNGTAINATNKDERQPHAVYTLDGRRLNTAGDTQLPHGIYIIDGKKVVR